MTIARTGKVATEPISLHVKGRKQEEHPIGGGGEKMRGYGTNCYERDGT